MNIDFIKWLTSYTKDYVFEMWSTEQPQLGTIHDETPYIPPRMEPYIVAHDFALHHLTDIYFQSYHFKRELYPLLLQRAIEGINKNKGYLFETTCARITIYKSEKYDTTKKTYFIDEFKNIDEAKEEALKYIWKTSLNDAKI